jgi:hypothetical protein
MEMEITVTEAGEVSVKVKGVKGRSCKDVSKVIEAALGKSIKSVATGEMYQEAQNVINTRR